MDSSRLRAISGMKVLSSSWPWRPATPIAASLPTTWAATWFTTSQSTGFTFPGMMDEPGWSAGSSSSPSPARGPDPSRRRSLAIFESETATTRSWPLASTAASRADCASTWSAASRKARPVAALISATTAAAKPGGQFSPVPTAVPPIASSASPSAAR